VDTATDIAVDIKAQKEAEEARKEAEEEARRQAESEAEARKKAEEEAEKAKIKHGGDGLYKPESGLWLLPRGIKAQHVKEIAEYRDAVCKQRVRYCRWPRNVGGNAGNAEIKPGIQPDYNNRDLYHNFRLKARSAKVSANGHTLGCWGRNGKLLAKKTIIDRNTRQE